MDYTDLVKPTTYADEDGLHELLTAMRRDAPVAWIEPPTHEPFWAITKHADIIEISRADDQFLNAPRVVLQTRERQAEQLERQARGGGDPYQVLDPGVVGRTFQTIWGQVLAEPGRVHAPDSPIVRR